MSSYKWQGDRRVKTTINRPVEETVIRRARAHWVLVAVLRGALTFSPNEVEWLKGNRLRIDTARLDRKLHIAEMLNDYSYCPN